jgi:small conductance mechanosensitive channel
MDATSYQQQVIGATGEISTDIFDPRVLWSLIKKSLQKLVDLVVEDGPSLLLNLLIFAAIFFVFRKLANIVQRLIEAGLDRSQLQLSQLLRSMIVSISRNIVLIIGILLGLSQVGISLGPVLAGLGVAGFVIGFALQDSLSNFASGMMILSYRPFDVGDVVEAGGVFGTVSHMSLVNTTIMTFDNQTLVVPNNKIWGDVIKNVTSQRTRRVDLVFGISYSDDIPRTEALLREILAADERVLTNPEPMVRLNELADSSVNFIVRPWVKTEDYWDVYWDVTREVKLRFDEADVSIPFPQTDVHLKTEQAVGVQVQEDSSGHSA